MAEAAPEEQAPAGTALAPEAEAPDPLQPRPRRTAMSGLETRVLVRELQALVGGFLDKAYQPSADEVMLRFRAPAIGRRDLYVRRGQVFCLAATRPENPERPTGFAMAMRKHACGGKVFEIRQEGYDRVVTIAVQKKEGDVRIVLEFLGDGNVLLLRPDGRILLPLVHESWAARTLRPGVPYQPPPAREDPFALDEMTFTARVRTGNRDVVRALAIEGALGGPAAEEVCLRAGLVKGMAASELDDAAVVALWKAWEGLRNEANSGAAVPHLALDAGRPVDFSAYDSAVLRKEAAASDGRITLQPMPSLSAALDALYLFGAAAGKSQEKMAEADTRLSKLEKQRQTQEAAVVKFRSEIESKVREGEILFAQYAMVERIRESILAARRTLDWKAIKARIDEGKKAGNPDAAAVVRLDPERGLVVLRLADPEGGTKDVPIDISKGVHENAQAAYERSKTARDKLAGAEAALAVSMSKLTAVSAERGDAEKAARAALSQPRYLVGPERHHWFEAFRWFVASSGELVVGGRDAAGNDRVVKKHLADGDRYVHADVHGAPSVVVKEPAPGKAPTDEALREAATLAVAASKAFGQVAAGDAYWVSPPQVSKTPQSGEYLARGAFIVRGERNWLRKLPLVISAGLVWLDGGGHPVAAPADGASAPGLRPKIMGGPQDAVHAHAERWVDVSSGQEERTAVVKRIARALSAHPDAVDRALPQGRLAIVGSRGVTLSEDKERER